jgi:hypothetical protein
MPLQGFGKKPDDSGFLFEVRCSRGALRFPALRPGKAPSAVYSHMTVIAELCE